MATSSAPGSTVPPEPPSPIDPKVIEYLEKIIGDSYKREFDQEENIWRSLAPFSTALGLLAGSSALLHNSIPAISWSIYSIILHIILLILSLFIALIFYFLYVATKKRSIDIPTEESTLLAYAADLQSFYARANRPEDQIAAAVVDDLRELVVHQLAVAARSSRQNNLVRIMARSRAILSLGVALILLFAAIGAILFKDAVT